MVLKTFSFRGVRLRNRLGFSLQTVLMSVAVVGVIAMDALQAVAEKAPEIFTAVDLLTGAVLTLQLYVIKRVGDHEKSVSPKIATMCERLEHMPTKEEMVTSLQETRHTLRNEVQVVAADLEEKIATVDDRVTNMQEGM